MYMIKQKIFSTTEARQNFFKILKLVEDGTNAIIEKRDTNKRYSLTFVIPKKVKKREITHKWDQIDLNLKGMEWKQIKKIMNNRYDLR